MFYSEALLAKTGPLARVWLSANVERKLSKSHVLSSNIEDSVNEIINRGQAPLALRLSSTLLLGVVRLYSRKARYLLDDCNEAILKIKMAFRPGNVDLAANQSHTASAAALNLPDVLTEVDLLGPGPDPSLLLLPDEDPSLLNFDVSQPLQSSIGRDYASSVLGESQLTERPIEVGRRDTQGTLQDGDTTLPNPDDEPLDDMGITFDLDEPLPTAKAAPQEAQQEDIGEPSAIDDMQPADLEDVPMDDVNGLPVDDPLAIEPPVTSREDERERVMDSPLSDMRPSVERELERSFRMRESDIFEADEPSVHHAQRAKKRKVLHPDTDTMIRSDQVRRQQEDRTKILKPASYLPHDPVLLALMEMQRNGSFVSNILGDGRSKGWAPELRGVLSLEIVRGNSDLKRKRDSGIAGVGEDQEASPDVQEEPQAEPDVNIPADEREITLPAEGNTVHFAENDDIATPVPSERHADPQDNFDETTIPLLHPADGGPISLGTKHAVHMLRDKFGSAAENSPTKRVQSSALFTDICPEKTTTRADATKMFFETLVLATKDAVKIEQEDRGLGAPMRVRAKRGLWGNWAETEAGGEIAGENGQSRPEVLV